MIKIEHTPNNDPVIDWELGTRLAANRQDLAKELLIGLANGLPAAMQEIKQAKESNKLPELLKFVHKLHGAACYCGVPRLKKILSVYEKALRNNEIEKLDSFYAELDFEITEVIRQVL